MPGFYLNEFDAETIREMARRMPKGRTRGLANRRRPRLDSASEQGQITGFCVDDVSPDEDIKIGTIELLWGAMPEGVEEDEPGASGQFEVRNLFKQQYVAGQEIVAFETDDRSEVQEENPGLSVQDALDLASSDAVTDLAQDEAVGSTTGGEIVWWGFGVTPGTTKTFITTSVIAAAGDQDGSFSLGSGSANPYDVTTPGATSYVRDTDTTETIYTSMPSPTPSDTRVECALKDGRWLIILEECPTP